MTSARIRSYTSGLAVVAYGEDDGGGQAYAQ
jgi:hypothetical protein